MGNFPTYMLDILYLAPRFLISFTHPPPLQSLLQYLNHSLHELSFHQRWAQAVYNPPPTTQTGSSLADRFLESLTNSSRGQSSCAQQDMELR